MPTDKEIRQRRKVLKEFAGDRSVWKLLEMKPKTRGKCFDLAEDLNGAFQDKALLALCDWRHKLKDPRPTMNKAVEIALRAAELLVKYHKPDRDMSPFWFPPAIYFSKLLSGEFDDRLVRMLPEFESWRSVELVTTLYLDVGHVMALTTGQYPDSWSDMIQAFLGVDSPFKKPPVSMSVDIRIRGEVIHLEEFLDEMPSGELYAQTHDVYRQLLTGHQDRSSDDLNKLMLEAVANYEQRADDELFEESFSTEGGPIDNAYCVDYRLATIVDHCYSARRDELPPSVIDHLWPPTPLKGKS